MHPFSHTQLKTATTQKRTPCLVLFCAICVGATVCVGSAYASNADTVPSPSHPPAIALCDQAIKDAGIPIDGISGWPVVTRIDFQPEATEAQKAQAWDIVNHFDAQKALAALPGAGLTMLYGSAIPTLTTDGQIAVAEVNGSPYLYFQSNGVTQHILGESSFEISPKETTDALSGEKMQIGDFVIGMIDKNLANGTTEDTSSLHGIWVKWSSVQKQLIDELKSSGMLVNSGATVHGGVDAGSQVPSPPPSPNLSLSGSLTANALNAQTLSLEESLAAKDGRFAGDLYVDGVFHVRDLFVPNAMHIDGNLHAASLEVESGAIINGTLTLNSDLTVTKNMIFASGSVLAAHDLIVRNALHVLGPVTIEGLAQFLGNVEIKGELMLSNKQAGFAEIPETGTSVTVIFTSPLAGTPVVTASPDVPVLYAVSRATATGFIIRLAGPAAERIGFSWTALTTSGAQMTTGHAAAGNENPTPFIIDQNGVPVSSDAAWNSCIRNNPILTADGSPVSCGSYHDGYTWEHPDLHIQFVYNTSLTPALLQLPDGYATIVREEESASDTPPVPVPNPVPSSPEESPPSELPAETTGSGSTAPEAPPAIDPVPSPSPVPSTPPAESPVPPENPSPSPSPSPPAEEPIPPEAPATT